MAQHKLRAPLLSTLLTALQAAGAVQADGGWVLTGEVLEVDLIDVIPIYAHAPATDVMAHANVQVSRTALPLALAPLAVHPATPWRVFG